MLRPTRKRRRSARRRAERNNVAQRYEEQQTAIRNALAGQLSLTTEDWLRIRRISYES